MPDEPGVIVSTVCMTVVRADRGVVMVGVALVACTLQIAKSLIGAHFR